MADVASGGTVVLKKCESTDVGFVIGFQAIETVTRF